MSLLSSSSPASPGLSSADLIKLKRFSNDSLIRELESANPPYEQRQTFVNQKLVEIFGRLPTTLPDSVRQQVTQEVINDVLGYGPIQPLLDDPDVSEVMVNGPKSVYVEKNGQ